MKRAIDIAFSAILLIVTLPVMACAALAIRLSSPGGVFYRATRMGKDGNLFKLYKFRTMVSGADKGTKVTLRKDPRVTNTGHVLRMTKIDELPQLLNVLRGEMSIVGPRPEDPVLVNRYYTNELRQTLRFLPGLTSPGTLAYLNGLGDSMPSDDNMDIYASQVLTPKLQLDLAYFRHQSILGDIKIILKTLVSVVQAVLARRSQ
jgi:lipopolysaccharide/colanic/teichoic acid biosynthesis glycosyltransferase